MEKSMERDKRNDVQIDMNLPLVSIIIPSYNYGHYILNALNSVSAQRYSDWECIVVDDGSTDDTARLVANYIQAHKDQPIHYLHIKNGGLSNARNVGIKHSKGKYLQFLDADDLIQPDKLKVQTQLLTSIPCALVYSDSLFFTDEATDVERFPSGILAKETLMGAELWRRIIQHNLFPVSSALVHKELVEACGMFDTQSKTNEDWLIWFKIALLNPHFTFDNSPDTATEIRVHEKGITGNKRKMFEGGEYVRNQFNSLLKSQITSHDSAKLIKYNLDLLALLQIRSLNFGTGFKYVMKEFIRQPTTNFKLLKNCFIDLTKRTLKNEW